MTPEEFARTYIPLGEDLYRLAFSMLGSEQEAEDAVQDLFVKLLSARNSLDRIRNPKAWSYVLMRNLCTDRLRTGGIRPGQVPLPEDLPDELPEADDRLTAALAAVRSLGPKNRSLLRMRLVEGLSYEEISRQTGQSLIALRVSFHRIKKQLRKKI